MMDSSHIIDQNAIKIAIIGGGLTGLFTATLLEKAFSQRQQDATSHTTLPYITLFEKSRSVGRLATRYRSDTQTASKDQQNWQWAFGAQFFTAKSANFSEFIQPWLATGLLQPWCAKVVELTPTTERNQQPVINEKEQWNDVQARYISTPKMTSWGRELAKDLQHSEIKFKTRVAPLSHAKSHAKSHANKVSDNKTDDKKTELFDDSGASLGWFDWVICTAPNGQALELMADSGFSEQAKILKSKMLACYTLMLGWDSLKALPQSLNAKPLNANSSSAWDVAYPQDSILAKIFVEHHKPNHDQLLPSVTIHANNEWSEANVDEDIETVKAKLLAAAQNALNWDENTTPSQVDCHRWRYAATIIDKSDDELGILVDTDHNWIVSGDWCGQGNIESCYRMAEDTVEVVAGVLGR